MIWHPVEPALALLRAAYHPPTIVEAVFGVGGSVAWSAMACRWGAHSVAGAMRDTGATGGR
jgi:hypothetical protein